MTPCAGCGEALPPLALSCHQCKRLVHAQQLQALSAQAKLAQASGDLTGARAVWARALSLLPSETVQYRGVQAHITDLDARLAATGPEAQDLHRSQSAKWLGRLGVAGVVIWKFKIVALFVLTKAKLLLLGFTKLSTLTSMLAAFGLYWTWYGWKFAAGLVISIYIHEMGHVAALRRFGIAATAPMFIPGFGAFVMLKQRPATLAQDARSGLAGPIWGLGATVAAWLAGVLSAQPIWFAIAHVGAAINLFNLIPVWQLDGGRGFNALTRRQRGWALAAAVVMWAVTADVLLLFIVLGAGYRLFSKDYAAEPDRGALLQYGGLVVLLSLLLLMCTGAARPF